MRRNFKNSSSDYRNYWIIYILIIILMLIIHIILSFYCLDEVAFPLKMYNLSVFFPLPIYLLESFITCSTYVEIFSEIKSINLILKPSIRENIMQLSKGNNLKIIFVLLLFVVQLVIISVKCFVHETYDLQV